MAKVYAWNKKFIEFVPFKPLETEIAEIGARSLGFPLRTCLNNVSTPPALPPREPAGNNGSETFKFRRASFGVPSKGSVTLSTRM